MAKKPAKVRYRAGGFSQDGIMAIIGQVERKFRSRPGYPWSKAVKTAMAKACEGRKTKKAIRDTILSMRPNG